jgi:hypothetical protein
MGAPPVGFVADNTDCDDKDPAAHPGQTMFFGAPSKGGRWDYDCDDKQTKETPEYINGTCKFCGAVGSCDATTTTCSTANQTASFVCPQEIGGGIVRAAAATELAYSESDLSLATGAAAGDPTIVPRAAPGAVLPPPICKVCVLQCCGCNANDKTGFRQAVDCGVSSVPAYTCGSCAAAGGPASAMTQSFKQQRCR